MIQFHLKSGCIQPVYSVSMALHVHTFLSLSRTMDGAQENRDYVRKGKGLDLGRPD
ncbi:predicted protein [Plenodomus lingam JN3]|uniref:Predicted protein n=1 Tax=Leptosphaeria maculans (strain JN3 / isolate v23.1.3 / race Av1-4-5-6-7-8) TaxID=985895 RepID=E5A9T0_LEPMJ|nr:predicted protein [Plenodomus lingam JN3]CBY00421.1 predicted protein [Plenodomus lingam JN3]